MAEAKGKKKAPRKAENAMLDGLRDAIEQGREALGKDRANGQMVVLKQEEQ